ncbi:hypothetical protein [Leptospira noguchii]|uniref:Uncharacterized protein n=2 Tax=Leptospira noguchii TaxID=28182 RepID=A0AAE9GFE8_9LEPT|nr:hypothetical protein [Leptospira noguchii]UOG56411.1 hypothetical protein MAL03_16670 [Leptospira noguchii]
MHRSLNSAKRFLRKRFRSFEVTQRLASMVARSNSASHSLWVVRSNSASHSLWVVRSNSASHSLWVVRQVALLVFYKN